MSDKYSKCRSCPAYHLLTEKRKAQIDYWEEKRDSFVNRMKQVKLILIGESMPNSRYFYDLNTNYDHDGLRFTLKDEFGKNDINDGLFLISMCRKGIILFDCALCPLHKLDDNILMRKAATHCFLTINIEKIEELKHIPIVTIFPSNRGWNVSELPLSIKNRIVGNFGFSSQFGLASLFEQIKKQ